MWKKKQRVVSQTEPELGVGVIIECMGQKQLRVHFSSTEEFRNYNLNSSSPIRRFTLKPGDQAFLPDGHCFDIENVEHIDGIYKYSGSSQEAWEYELGDQAADQGTLDFFINGNFSHFRTYDLRKAALEIKSHREASRIRGLVGPRVSPLPHQMYVADTVSRRARPRVLLADEVGLGKTIEAGLIFSALRSLDRAGKVLFLVPESLKHQWLAEMYRRFNELVTVLDEDRCIEEEQSQGGGSAFENLHKILCSIDFLQDNTERLDQALKVDWDLIIVDEAHHLSYKATGEQNTDWQAVKSLSEKSRGLLLLTATPSMYGPETQFGLLNILDPEKYSSYDDFHSNAEHVKQVAQFAKQINQTGLSDAGEAEVLSGLKKLFPKDKSLLKIIESTPLDKNKLTRALVDRHGTGRVFFRNRRANIKGFPKRNLTAVPLDKASLKKRTHWLKDFQKKLDGKKALVLCSTKEQVKSIQRSFEKEFNEDIAIFHEELSIVERDKQAAQFAQSSDVQLLVCSEIGGEGRNFQFCHNLVLFDVPKHPDLIEQRIGRLDRIGQGSDIEIFALFETGCKEELLFRWYNEGLNSFCKSWNGASTIFDQFSSDLERISQKLDDGESFSTFETEINQLICSTKKEAEALRISNEEGADILVDLNSFNKEQGDAIAESVEDQDDNPRIELFMKDLFDHYAIEYQDFDSQGSLLVKGDSLSFIEDFPGISSTEDTALAFDREVALKREDVTFLSQDHYMVEECLSFLLERNEGVASVCKWPNSQHGNGALIEISVVLESSGPKHLELGRYLPSEQKNYVINHMGKQIHESSHLHDSSVLRELSEAETPVGDPRINQFVTPQVERALAHAETWAQEKVQKAIASASSALKEEHDRMTYLAQVNPSVSQQDIADIQYKASQMIKHLESSQPRLDAIRLIFTEEG